MLFVADGFLWHIHALQRDDAFIPRIQLFVVRQDEVRKVRFG